MPYVREGSGDRELLLAAFAQLPHGLVVVDRDLRYVAINEALARSNGKPLDEHVGRRVDEVLPGTWPMLQPLFDRVLAGETVTQTWSDIWVASTGAPGSVRTIFVPVRRPTARGDAAGPGEVAGVVVMFQDVTEEVRQRRLADRSRDLAVALSSLRTRDEVVEVTRRLCAEELGASSVLLSTHDNSVDELVMVTAGTHGRDTLRYERVPMSFDCPATAAFLSGEPVVALTKAENDAPWPNGPEAAAADPVTASVTLPLVIEQQPVGVLGVCWENEGEIPADALAYLQATAARVAGVVARVVALEREDQASARESALLRVASRLNSLDGESDVATAIAQAVVDLTGAGEAGLHLVTSDGRSLVRVDRAEAIDPHRREKYDQMPLDTSTPVGFCVTHRKPVWLDRRRHWDQYPSLRDDVAAMSWPSVAVVPLAVGDADGGPGTPFGALYAHFKGPRLLLPEDRRFLETVAELAASTLERIRIGHAEQRARAELAVTESQLERLSQSGVLGTGSGTVTHIVTANRALLDMLGYADLPAGGLDWRALTPPEWAEADARAIDELSCTGRVTFEKEYYRADGTRLPVLLSIAAYRQQPLSTVLAAVDLTHRRELERRERQSLLERDHLSRAVQAALFPRLDLEGCGWRVQVAYRPGDGRMALGGDFYDAVALPGGRLAAAIGDVTGHGPAAAATGSAVRAAWRALLMAGEPLRTLPVRLSEVLLSERETDLSLASLLTVMLHPDGAVQALSLGHPAPVLLSGGDARCVPVRHNLILGSPVVEPTVISKLTLAPTERLVLYTDGLIEARSAPDVPDRLGVGRFVSRLRSLGPDVDPDAVIESVAGYGEGLSDDAAVVILGPRSR